MMTEKLRELYEEPAQLLELDARAEGALADEQGWACVGCGDSLAGGLGHLALAKSDDGLFVLPVLAHEECIDDGRRKPRLTHVGETAQRGNPDTALNARIGALHHHARGRRAAYKKVRLPHGCELVLKYLETVDPRPNEPDADWEKKAADAIDDALKQLRFMMDIDD